uniref:Uncharacterized protein n=1 Tax=Globisporangium ultimum (strain ATCC 200006 / CBS 805.95 / DAOM BR144) TaxID=431595 RepID=K3WXY7_GLOUD
MLVFARGVYGLLCCTLGFFPGFIIGCYKAPAFEPAITFVSYLSALWFHIRDVRAFWVFNMVIDSLLLAIVLLHCIGSLPYVNLAKNTAADSNVA